MTQSVDAIYENGQLRLLEKVDLHEGQRIKVILISERDQFRAAMGDLLVKWPEPIDDLGDLDDLDDEALMEIVREGFKGVTLSDIIIQERREGP